MTKTIYSGFGESFWLFVAQRLAEENGWQPVYWVADPQVQANVEREYSGVIFHSVFDAIKGIPPAAYAARPIKPIDERILSEYAVSQLILLRMMDRINALGSFDYNDRVRLLHNQMMYWRTVLDDLQPDVVVFSVIPHMIYDYVLYVYCKRRGIKTLMFESTPLQGKTFIMEEFDKPSRAQKLYQKLLEEGALEAISISEEMDSFIQSLKGAYQDVPVHIRRNPNEKLYQGPSSSSKSLIQKIFDFESYSKYFSKQKRILLSRLTPPKNYLKQPRKKLEDSEMNFLDYWRFRAISNRRMRRLERHYRQLAGMVDFGIPYVYVALNYQPERTTSPMASIFVDQFLIVDMLAKAVPAHWQIYVKEHPTQFTPVKFFRAQSGRTIDMYDDMTALPNVTLVPISVSSYDLIDHARSVAVATGTVGWEAVHRGKPVLLFGYPWYRGCEGTFQIDTYESCVEVLQKICDGYKINPLKLKLFVSALEQTAIEASVEPHLRIINLTDDEIALRLTHAIQEYQIV